MRFGQGGPVATDEEAAAAVAESIRGNHAMAAEAFATLPARFYERGSSNTLMDLGEGAQWNRWRTLAASPAHLQPAIDATWGLQLQAMAELRARGVDI